MANYILDYSGAQVSAKLDQLGEMSGIAVQDTAPTQNIKMWLDTSGNPLTLPEIDDSHINAVDTWSSQKINNAIGAVSGKVDDLTNLIGIVVDGNTSSLPASIGQYVILRNSTITSKDDGLYTAAKAISANTPIDGTYLQGDNQGNPISGGVVNDLKNTLLTETEPLTPTMPDVDTTTHNIGFRYYRAGKVVTLFFSVKITNAQTGFANRKIIKSNIPSKFRPPVQVDVICSNGYASGYTVGQLTSSGDLIIYPQVSGTTYAIGSVTYVIN